MTDITQLLNRLTHGEPKVLEELTPLVYQQLRQIAQNQLQEQDARRWDATELVHEAYLRLVGDVPVDWKNRTHFFAVAAKVIRQILVDEARKQGAQKRGGDYRQANVDLQGLVQNQSQIDLVALDEALTRLAELNERQAKLVELRFFGGLSQAEAAEFLNVSRRTVAGDWAMARAWLFRELS